MAKFNEDNTIEKMVLSSLSSNGWKYIPAEDLPRTYSDVMVEPMVKEALIRLNPEIAAEPSRADEVIYKLRTLILTVQPHDLVTQNELFKKLVFEEKKVTMAEYKAMSRDQQSDVKDCGGFIGGYCNNGSRSDIRFRSVLCLDADFADNDLWSDWEIWYGNAAFC